MRKIILNLAISLDGFIEGPHGEFDWCFSDQDYGMAEFLKSVDSIFFGRKSYDLMLSFGKDQFPNHRKYVFSRSLKKLKDPYIPAEKSPELFVNSFRSNPGKHIWLFGGKSLFNEFLKYQLVDELLLSIHPILLGGGKTLFDQQDARIQLKLIETKSFDSGLVQLRYRLK